MKSLQYLTRPSNSKLLGYLLLAPALVLIAIIVIFPLFLAFDLSLQDVKIARLDRSRGELSFDNYFALFQSPEFWNACLVTCALVFFVTACCLLLGILTALLVNTRFRGRRLARLLVTLPWAVPELIAAVLFTWLFDSSFGVVNWIIVSLGLSDTPVQWLSEPVPAFFAVSVTMIWKGYPFVSLMALAGLQSIPDDLYNAARVDGAGRFQRLLYITLPSLRPVIGVTAILAMLWVFRDFSIIHVLTGGGPFNSTQTLAILTYDEAFSNFRMGYASAIGIITLVICIISCSVMLGRQNKAIY